MQFSKLVEPVEVCLKIISVEADLPEVDFPVSARHQNGGVPPSPSPRSLGIIDLEGKCDLIYGAQSLAGKILMSKNLQAGILKMKAQNGTVHFLPTVTASTMIAHGMGCAQG